MKFISDNPFDKYEVINYNGKNIFLDKNDVSKETLKNAKSFCRKYRYSLNTDKAVAVYYLRGHHEQAAYGQVLKGMLCSDPLPKELREIIHCLSFWNQEGTKNYAMNKAGNESYPDFILKCIAADCRAFVTPFAEQFITGKGGNHIWVDNRDTNERILLIHF
ncbi:hypothetical protein [Mucilaginibacter polytrichastri]|nr:hypothetical protein [Mucilaginibacter polytrichastri]SFS61770.1 hypothetical protein SAMN04487890_102391 [Mucilaginibacter polytrichastri]